jgi:hypothetical protein
MVLCDLEDGLGAEPGGTCSAMSVIQQNEEEEKHQTSCDENNAP